MDKNLLNINSQAFVDNAVKSEVPPMTHIDFPQKKLPDSMHKTYHVYKTATEFVEVEALTASEAIEKSGVKSPIKIKRSHVDLGPVIDSKIIVDDTVTSATVETITPPPAPSIDTPSAAPTN